jgi:hypothetical protein
VGKLSLTRQTSGELTAMEEGKTVTPSIAERPILTRTDSQDFDIEEGRANPQVAIDIATTPTETPNERPTLTRSNTGELNAMETGSVDVESGFGSGRGGKKRGTKKSRKGRKTRKGGKRRKSHRR